MGDEEFVQIEAIPVECESLVPTVVFYWSLLYQMWGDMKGREGSQNIIDLVRIFKKNATKSLSKSELVESITKHGKLVEEFRRLEFQLQSTSKQFTMLKLLIHSTLNDFNHDVDIVAAKKILLDLSCYIDLSKDMSIKESLSDIVTLLQYINNIPNNFACCPVLLPFSDLGSGTMKFINTVVEVKTHHDENHPSETISYLGQAYRCAWQGALVGVKKYDIKIFRGEEYGVRHAVSCMQLNSSVVRQPSPFLNSLLAASVGSDGAIYFISALAPLGSLYDVYGNPDLEAHQRMELVPAHKLNIVLDICAAVDHLHKYGIVHGRIKDANVLLFEGNRAKLDDYGLQLFCSNTARRANKGTHGLRWTAPEMVAEEERLKCIESDTAAAAARSKGGSGVKVLRDYLPKHHSLLQPALDIYGVGLLMLSLITQRVPFYNVLSEEGVHNALLTSGLPALPSTYPDADVYFTILSTMHDCLGPASERPATIKQIVPVVEQLYCEVEFKKLNDDLAARDADMVMVQGEKKDIAKKIKQHVELIAKGKDLIAKKDEEKIMIHNMQQRRERELDIEKARVKLRGFEDELKGLQEDLGSIEHDIGELFKLQKELRDKIAKGKAYALEERRDLKWASDYNQEPLIARYCTERERERIQPLIRPTALGDLAKRASTNRLMNTEALSSLPASVKNPFSYSREGSTDVALERKKAIEAESRAGKYEYQHLIDNLDIVFRVPVSTHILVEQQQYNDRAYNAYMASLPYEEEPERGSERDSQRDSTPAGPKSVAAPSIGKASISLSSIQTEYTMKLLEQTRASVLSPAGTKPGTPGAAVAAAAQENVRGSVSTPTSNRNSQQIATPEMAPLTSQFARGGAPISNNTPITPQMNPMHAPPTTHKQAAPSSAKRVIELDSDEDEEEVEAMIASGAANDYVAPRSKRSQSIRSSFAHRHDNTRLVSTATTNMDESYDFEEGDEFPDTDEDLLRVQYLSAVCGSWNEAVGICRLGHGLNERQIKEYVDANFTPVHLAAKLGNYEVCEELIEYAGGDPQAVDNQGNTALHCASRKGHFHVITMLCEKYQLSPLQYNKEGLTPVQEAVAGGFLAVVRYYMEKAPIRVPPTFKDREFGASLLHWACFNSYINVVDYLLNTHGLAVALRADCDNSTCLHWACSGGSLAVVKHLIEHCHADPKLTNNKGLSCLHLTAYSGNVEKSNYLMTTVGLQITDKDEAHKSPFDVATGKCSLFLQERKNRGFVSGSVVETQRKIKKKHLA